ncbi:MAG TPA: FAD-dependent oxidoreductase [Gaiellales bacterium]|jgi:2,4-dienoyl-CoA reductase-like NADH-dependent reductase (Old Yellow Enzyme family)
MPYPLLLRPLRIGPIEIRNRIVSTAHQTTLVEDGLPTDDFVAYHAARAAGGVGMICIEATAVHPSGLLTGHTIAGYDPRVVGRLATVAEAVHAGGGTLFAQLFHGGREQIEAPPRAPAVAPSAVPSQRFKVEPRALGAAEIEEIIAHHELVAGHARAAGLDGLELCASHGYLPTQFLSARTNRRDDAWGGDAERRMRYVREALLAMRRGAGDGLAIGIRLSADESIPEGRHAPETAEILRTLAGEGLIDYASTVIGDSASYVGAAWIVPPPPIERDAMWAPASVLHEQLGVPLIATSRVHEPVEAEALLASGAADAVGMTRALIADPDLPRRIAGGDESGRILCTGCNQGCIGHYHLGIAISCLQNPRTGRERTLPDATPQAGSRVAVIGGGPAGMAAAVAAARAGAAVTLFEAADVLGGQFALAGRAPAHRETAARFRADWTRRLAAAGVDVRLGARATVADAVAASADRVIVATGAVAHRPAMTAPAGVAIVDGWDAIRDPAAVAGPVLVADWGGGWTGLDAAEVIAGAGARVWLAVAAPLVGETVHQYQRVFYLARLERLGVTILHHRELVDAAGGAQLRSLWTHAAEPLPDGVRTLVLALGREPVDALVHACGERGVPCTAVGDCRGARSLEEAILEGTTAGEHPPATVAEAV